VSAPKRQRLELISTPEAVVAPANRGRLLYVSDVAELLGQRKSDWWIRHRFAPHTKIKIGRDCAWYESDAYSWLDAQRGKSA